MKFIIQHNKRRRKKFLYAWQTASQPIQWVSKNARLFDSVEDAERFAKSIGLKDYEIVPQGAQVRSVESG